MVRIFIFLVCFPLHTLAQINESFSDNDFTNNPHWAGQSDRFIVNQNQELQLNDTEAGTSFLSTSCLVVEEATWQFRVRMDFNPSSSNLAQVYLISNDSQLINATNAVFVELGNTADNICLYRVIDGHKEKMVEGASGRLSLSNVDVTIRVTRAASEWLVQSDLGSGWQTEGTAAFDWGTPSVSFGWVCKYTITRADKFFLDDIEVSGQPFSDKTPPEITNFELINGSSMQLTFNEALASASLTVDNFLLKLSQRRPAAFSYDEANNTITLTFVPPLNDSSNEQLIVSGIKDANGNSMVETSFTFDYELTQATAIELLDAQTLNLSFSKPVPLASFQSTTLLLETSPLIIENITTADEQEFTLTFSNQLNEGQSYQLTIEGLTDAIGDTLSLIEAELMYYHPKRFDIVFNEWMADPTPPMDLPEIEYIELFNTTSFDISLGNWQLLINDRLVELPDSSVAPQSFICLIDAADASKWEHRLPTVMVNNMPALNNSGFDMVLRNKQTAIIDAYRYKPTHVNGEPFKRDGGWSVERIDPFNLSNEVTNFNWCMDLSGGTPGAINSTNQNNQDNEAPRIDKIEVVNPQTLSITFSETMLLTDNTPIEISPAVSLSHQSFDSVFLQQLNLHFSEELSINVPYLIEEMAITDLSNHPIDLTAPLAFGLADSLESGDLLINEVLFNPYPEGSDFVELYNRSDKIIQLADVYFADVENNNIEVLHQVSKPFLLFPHSYVAISIDIESIKALYRVTDESTLIRTGQLPAYPDDEGQVVICNKYGQILDMLSYNEKMHFDLLKDKEGIALERLSWERPTHELSNWHSAASTAGFATPGYLNSQQTLGTHPNEGGITLAPEVFTPNGDGIDDRLQIFYTSPQAGTAMSIRIFDATGKEVRYLVNNATLSGEGYFIWDGLNENRAALQPGIYIVFCQQISPDGKVVEHKLTCVISQQTNN
ncbi:Ig-like domain-containing protein [Carboxylicivirga taeanensis]|uniref:Ig-like domain-containing protein n=1 Tax=Carboxylicivirga taeanensis TaxID=1416875 RepID=UPI003F6DDBBF